MGTLQQVLFIVLAAQSFGRLQDAVFPQDFGGSLDNNWLFPFDRNFDFPPFDSLFGSLRSWSPGFHMLDEIPPVNAPRVQVFCDDAKLTVVVEKKAFGLMLTQEEIQLGDGCYSTKELPNQFVFAYDLDQCGTTPVFQNGWQVFTNSLHLNLKKTRPAWWQTPSTVHISCIPKRSYTDPNHDPNHVPQQSVNEKSFDIQAMNSSWTTTAESNLYKRGHMVHLQVSAKVRPDQQLFIHSCFVSASPEPQTRPRHAVILNKGCASSFGSPYTVARFAATNRADVVNFMLNTSNLISELYVHCSVVVLDRGLTSATKSCSYNVNKSRWEELNGNTKVCSCCRSKCKGQSFKSVSDDAKAVVSIGPMVIVDDDQELNPTLPESKPQTFSSLPTTMMSNAPSRPEDLIVSASSLSQSVLESSPQGVVMVSQDPTTRLTLWLPGQVPAEPGNVFPFGDDLSTRSQPGVGDRPEQQRWSEDDKALLNSPSNEVAGLTKSIGDPLLWDVKLVTLTDGWPISSRDGEVSTELPRIRLGRSGNFAAKGDSSLSTGINVNLMFAETTPDGEETEAQTKRPVDVNEPAVGERPHMDTEPEVDLQPIIRTRLEFTKSADGSKKLSYEEEVEKRRSKKLSYEEEVEKRQGKQESKLQGLRLTFLNLLRRMNKAE